MVAATKKHGLAVDSTPAKRARRTNAAADIKRPAATNRARKRDTHARRGRVPSTPGTLNSPPTVVLDVLVFGDGEAGELGLGPHVTGADSPTLNPFLSASTTTTGATPAFDTVQVACGGMHSVALTRDNLIVTWGVNDLGALGRDTSWDGGFRTISAAGDGSGGDDSSDTSDDETLNPRESTPTAIPSTAFPEGTRFVQVAAGDNCSFALTDAGAVYGWGAFRAPNGETFFSADRAGGAASQLGFQRTPVRVPGLQGITQLAVGANHALALEGRASTQSAQPTQRTRPQTRLWTWGCGDQNQLGCRLLTRHGIRDPRGHALIGSGVPRMVALQHAGSLALVASGEYHSFAVGTDGRVWAWGLNSFGQTGAEPDIVRNPNDDNAELSVAVPTEVTALAHTGVVALAGGGQHSVALSADGRCLVWGRVDSGQLGLDLAAVAQDRLLADARGRIRACLVPTDIHLSIDGGPQANALATACGTGHTLIVTSAAGRAGHAAVFGTGFNAQMQLGLGAGADEEVAVPTRLESEALQERYLTWAGAGGQFSMVAGPRRAVGALARAAR
ncbi:regulator of chromosome condensation [Sporothrix brasiliensis 5110]|uniref:Regulator of chromosome condensation n=1 Tax=Sporothrix brasiliensis 5110 TaxID=1398154 RepID=A0A0C2IAT9_9PEZI|nr:regulator of chromosome condensation [Sporothrix brasiliensis 5110]KIH86371.1 regulator of chromosome condensation [Sporothrix brasiliensis 5110]